tara:strand:- start:285 stop:605 length:321 start_codon:yes stop_codon:yes gene_type:complete
MVVRTFSQSRLKGNIFYSTGINQYNIDLKQKSKHAEVDAINNLKKSKKPKKLSLFVFRVNRHGEICNAKPCECCHKYIIHEIKRKNYKLGKIWYTDVNGDFKFLKN